MLFLYTAIIIICSLLYSEFCDGSVSSVPSLIIVMESELQTTKHQLLQEIEKRKAAEDALNMMCYQWQRISNVLSEAGLTLPSPSAVIGGMQLEPASIENLLQEVIVARFVAEAIGKGQSRAEAELATEAILESKNQEISRLRDRLLYYETANREMSERNQEIIGMLFFSLLLVVACFAVSDHALLYIQDMFVCARVHICMYVSMYISSGEEGRWGGEARKSLVGLVGHGLQSGHTMSYFFQCLLSFY